MADSEYTERPEPATLPPFGHAEPIKQVKIIYPYFVAYVASINGQMCNGMATIPRNSPIKTGEDVKNLQAFLQLQFYQLQNIVVMNWITLEPIEETVNGEEK